jgi:hypothetical protein
MNPIRLPRVAAKAKVFAEIETRTHSRCLELRQTTAAATITVGDGHTLCRITAPPPAGVVLERVEPFLIDARAFAKAAGELGCGRTEPLASMDPEHIEAKDRPLVVYRLGERLVGVTGPEGEPKTIAAEPGRMPDAAVIFNGIRAEGRLVARVDPRFLQSAADMAVAAGITAVDVTFTPRLNFLATSGTARDGATVEVAVAGIGEVTGQEQSRPAWEAEPDDPLVFMMAEPNGRRASSPRKAKPQELDLPLDDIPF